jgi:hypothetical protein
MVGWVVISRKSAERRWSSRWGLLVSMEVRSIVAVTVEASGSEARTISPSKRVKWPRTLLTIMWRAVKATSEWTGSIVHVPAR